MIWGDGVGGGVRNVGEAEGKSGAQALGKPVENGWISMSWMVGEVVGIVFRMSWWLGRPALRSLTPTLSHRPPTDREREDFGWGVVPIGSRRKKEAI